jgi:hypothetical protein
MNTGEYESDITLPSLPITAFRSPSGKLYVTLSSKKIAVINTATDTIENTFDMACDTAQTPTTATFSQDAAYPYYYVHCLGATGKILKYNISDNTLADAWTIPGFSSASGVLNLDGSKLYLASSALALSGAPNLDKVYVLNTEDGSVIKTLQTIGNGAGGIIGIFQSPDFQHIYVSSPDDSFSNTGFSVVDMYTDTIYDVTDSNVITTVMAPASSVTTANVNVSVVLGVKTVATTDGGGQLAETGVAISTTLLLGLIIASLSYTYYDYRKHKKPLVAIDPNAKNTYTYRHHVMTVSIPLLKYRLSFKLQRQPDKIDHGF